MNTRIKMLIMTTCLWAMAAAAPAHAAPLLWLTPALHDCAFASDDTIRVDVMISASGPTVNSGGVVISYDPSKLGFIRGERGDLTSAWPGFSATAAGAEITVATSAATAIPQNSTGSIAKLVFVDKCCGLGSVQNIVLCIADTFGQLMWWQTRCATVTCVPASPGSLTVETVYHSCGGVQVDTLDVDVRVENAPQDIDAAGVDILFDGFAAEYVGFKRGNLTQAWPFFDAVITSNVVRVGGFTSNAIPAGTTGVFVTLRFIPHCCSGGGVSSSVCTQVLVDDFAGLTAGCGAVTCVPLATKPSSWGYVKSLYR